MQLERGEPLADSLGALEDTRHPLQARSPARPPGVRAPRPLRCLLLCSAEGLGRSVCRPPVPLWPGLGRPGTGAAPHCVLPDAAIASSVSVLASSRGLHQKSPAAVRVMGFPDHPPVPAPGTPCGAAPCKGLGTGASGGVPQHSPHTPWRVGSVQRCGGGNSQPLAPSQHTGPCSPPRHARTHTWSRLTPAAFYTHTHKHTCPAHHRHPHAGASPAHLTPTSHCQDALADTRNPRDR